MRQIITALICTAALDVRALINGFVSDRQIISLIGGNHAR
jgi:hypothetical protein